MIGVYCCPGLLALLIVWLNDPFKAKRQCRHVLKQGRFYPYCIKCDAVFNYETGEDMISGRDRL